MRMPKSRGLAKNLARAQTMFALANLYQVRNHLLPLRPGAPCEVHPANPLGSALTREPRAADLRPDVRTLHANQPVPVTCAEVP